jgi:intracellular sulfur oxidation DsrE/DsrF family protein
MPGFGTLAFAAALAIGAASADPWPAAKSPIVPGADGYVAIPGAAVPPDANRTYRAIYDATQHAEAPDKLLPAVNMAGSEFNAMGVAGVPRENVRFVLVFHGDAIDGLLDDARYRARFGVGNPNLKVLSDLRKAGAELYVCGQQLAATGVDPATLSPDVTVASDALIVLMSYQAEGYSLLSF